MGKRNRIKNLLARLKIHSKKIIPGVIIIVLALFSGIGIDFAIRPNDNGEIVIETSFSMHLAEKQLPAVVENSDGEEITEENIVTIEEIDGNQLVNECPEDEEECGQGRYVYAPTGTFTEFKDYTLGGCWDVDSAYGGQCWDLAALFWMNYTENGRVLSTCGTGAAYGAWNCKEQNAGDEFELIYDATQIQAGDWIIFSGGQYGHVGMALGTYNNGYVTLLGQNQGGAPCAGGGSSTNIINISTKNFLGAFRPKTYIKPSPTPIPISNCVTWRVLRGDTMSKIMLECEGTVVYGEAMNDYAKTWYSLVYKPGQSVYEGWVSDSGVGLYENDDIEHRI